jgi:hypothetical protein
MALPFDIPVTVRDPRAFAILAKTIYRELRAEGYSAPEVMALASELLDLVASEVKDRRDSPYPAGTLATSSESGR